MRKALPALAIPIILGSVRRDRPGIGGARAAMQLRMTLAELGLPGIPY